VGARYDSGMDDRTKREIKQLMRGFKDPRSMIAPFWYIMFTVSLQLVATGSFLIYGRWGLIIAGAYFVFYVAVIVQYVRYSKRMKARLVLNDFDQCIWCHYPFVGMPDRGLCAECGCGYDREVAQKLFKEIYQPAYRVPLSRTTKLRRARWWARALRERDRRSDD